MDRFFFLMFNWYNHLKIKIFQENYSTLKQRFHLIIKMPIIQGIIWKGCFHLFNNLLDNITRAVFSDLHSEAPWFSLKWLLVFFFLGVLSRGKFEWKKSQSYEVLCFVVGQLTFQPKFAKMCISVLMHRQHRMSRTFYIYGQRF